MMQRFTCNALSRTRAVKNGATRSSAGRRAFVQPSVADRARVVDVPSTYQDDGHFTPRSGRYLQMDTRTVLILRRYAWIQAGTAKSG
jgi:hypothetical protein